MCKIDPNKGPERLMTHIKALQDVFFNNWYPVSKWRRQVKVVYLYWLLPHWLFITVL